VKDEDMPLESPDRERDSIASSVTISDVAEAARVSIRTVSRVINNSTLVNKETREAVQAVIERLGFMPSSRARALASGRSGLIGVVQDDPNALVLHDFQRGIVETCSERGFELVVHPSKFTSPRLVEDVVQFVRRSRVDGLIVLSPISEVAAIPAALTQLGVPVVGLASVRIPTYPAMIVSGERKATAQVAEHFAALGHRRIALITGPRAYYSATEREQGFRMGLDRHGIALPQEYVREGDYGFGSGIRSAAELFDLAEPPTAIFASNDIMAAGALKEALKRNLTVPGRVSIAGFDDSLIASMISPALTSIRRPLLKMASQATERLLLMIGSGRIDRYADINAELTLVERESTGPAPAKDDIKPPRPIRLRKEGRDSGS
jgi:LacI family transcriptional regulator